MISSKIETIDMDALTEKTGSVFKALVIISKRSRSISSSVKEDLTRKLEQFSSNIDNLEEIFENKEQIEISKSYEKLPKSTLIALDEFMNDNLIYKKIEKEDV